MITTQIFQEDKIDLPDYKVSFILEGKPISVDLYPTLLYLKNFMKDQNEMRERSIKIMNAVFSALSISDPDITEHTQILMQLIMDNISMQV